MEESGRVETGTAPHTTPPTEAQGSSKMKVLVAIDDSDNSFYALKWVLDNFLSHGNSGEAEAGEPQEETEESDVVTLIHVMEPFPHYAFPGGYVIETATRAQEQNAARILSRAFEMCKDKSIKSKTLILEGEAKEMICQAAEQMRYDLLVVGSRGLGQIKRAFLGSVSDYCTHHAKCPVLIVKPPAKEARK